VGFITTGFISKGQIEMSGVRFWYESLLKIGHCPLYGSAWCPILRVLTNDLMKKPNFELGYIKSIDIITL
jgi:hypothetical protein